MELYRCGYCGSPTDLDGNPLGMSEIGLTKNLNDWDNATPVSGYCCHDQNQHESESRVISKEMAVDAGNPDLEGHIF